jgi:hypothetical protein
MPRGERGDSLNMIHGWADYLDLLRSRIPGGSRELRSGMINQVPDHRPRDSA